MLVKNINEKSDVHRGSLKVLKIKTQLQILSQNIENVKSNFLEKLTEIKQNVSRTH